MCHPKRPDPGTVTPPVGSCVSLVLDWIKENRISFNVIQGLLEAAEAVVREPRLLILISSLSSVLEMMEDWVISPDGMPLDEVGDIWCGFVRTKAEVREMILQMIPLVGEDLAKALDAIDVDQAIANACCSPTPTAPPPTAPPPTGLPQPPPPTVLTGFPPGGGSPLPPDPPPPTTYNPNCLKMSVNGYPVWDVATCGPCPFPPVSTSYGPRSDSRCANVPIAGQGPTMTVGDVRMLPSNTIAQQPASTGGSNCPYPPIRTAFGMRTDPRCTVIR